MEYLYGKSVVDTAHALAFERVNIEVVTAFVRQLADYRFGSNEQPLLTSHTDLSEWELTDVAAIWHGYRYGVPGLGPNDFYGRGYKSLKDFQDRSYHWREGLEGPNPIFIGDDAKDSITDAVPFLQCYRSKCD